MNETLTTDKYWESLNRIEEKRTDILFSKIFQKYLKKENNQERNALEIGCVPGIYLAYISKTFGYFPEGIDYVKNTKNITEKTLKNFGLNESLIYEHDFTSWQTNNKYDLVCSFGFVEHFKDTDVIILKHINLLKKGGQIIIEFPNFSNGQKIIHKLIDKKNLERHNTDIMNLDFFKKIAITYNLEINFLGYYGGLFDFWWENTNPSFVEQLIKFILRCITFITRRIPINNRFLSPYIILIATNK